MLMTKTPKIIQTTFGASMTVLIAMRSGDLRIGQQQYPGGNRSGPLINMRPTGQKGGL